MEHGHNKVVLKNGTIMEMDLENGVQNCLHAVYYIGGDIKFGLMQNDRRNGIWIESERFDKEF